jgi:hypothetical protein
VLDEVTDLAGQHEVIAENLQVFIIKEVTIFVKDFKEERKKVSDSRNWFGCAFDLPIVL